MANDVTIEGKPLLLLKMKEINSYIERDARNSLKKAGSRIIADAQRNLRTAGYNGGSVNATGRLSHSGKVQEVNGELEVGFFSSMGEKGYAEYVEYGRRAGKMPPVDNIEAWLKKKTSVRKGIKSAVESAAVFAKRSKASLLRGTAFAIAKHIGKRGTTPHPFFKPAVEHNKEAVEKAVSNAVNKILKLSK